MMDASLDELFSAPPPTPSCLVTSLPRFPSRSSASNNKMELYQILEIEDVAEAAAAAEAAVHVYVRYYFILFASSFLRKQKKANNSS